MARTKKSYAFERTDTGNAEWFAQLYQDQLRYDHRAKRWLVWRKHWWEADATEEVMRKAKKAARLRLRAAIKLPDSDWRISEIRWALTSEMQYNLRATIALAQSQAPLSDAGDTWDADPWLLGVANGVVDLRTGNRRNGLPSDRITMHTKIPFSYTAKCPRWEQFLAEIFVDEELTGYVQRAVGYSITGDTTEQCVFMCYGEGANGKTTFLEALRYAIGDYAHNTPFSTLESNGRSSIPNDVADLPGRRFVTAVETNESVQLNEARLKALTGSDENSARHLFKEFFRFFPVVKFWLAFNHKPMVRDDSYGFWRRIHLIPFLRTFKDGTDDKNLLAILKGEAPGILVWAVRGCLQWQVNGLGLPSVVQAATDEYGEESDPLRDFIDECCILQSEGSVPAGALWVSYTSWVKENGEPRPLDRNAFSRRLQARGLRKIRQGHVRTWTWQGICFTADQRAKHLPLLAVARPDADAKMH